MSLFRVLLVLVLSCNVYSFSQATDPVAAGGVTAQNITDRANKAIAFANAFPDRVLMLYKSLDESVNNFNEINTGFKGLSDLLTEVYSSTIKKELMGLPEQVEKKIAFVPAQKLIKGLLLVADEKLSLGIFSNVTKGDFKPTYAFGYLDALDLLVTSIKTFIGKLHPRVEAELARVLPVFATLKPYVKTANELNDATKNDRAKIIADTKVVTDLLLVVGVGELVPQDTLQAADEKLKIVESLITKIDEPLKKAEPIVAIVHPLSTEIVTLERQIVSLATPILKDTVKPMAKLAGEIKNNVLENANKYTAWLNAATFGVVKDIIEINKLDITTEEVKPLSKPIKERFVALQTFATNFTLSSKAGESQEQYEKEVVKYLIPELSKLPGLLTPIVTEFTNVGTQATTMVAAYMKFFNELSLTKISIGGKWLGIPFEKYRFFDTQSGAFRCFSRYMVMSSALNLGVVELKDLILFNTSCELITIAELKDKEVSRDFGDNKTMRAGQFYKAKMSYSQKFIDLVKNVPLLKDIFKSGATPVSGELLNVGPGKFLGTQIAVSVNQNIDIFAGFNQAIAIFNKGAGGSTQLTAAFKAINTAVENLKKAFKLKLTSFGAAVVENALVPGTPKIVFPIKGTIDLALGADFKPTIAMGMVFDPAPEKLSGTLSGVWEGSWKNAFGLPDLTLSKLGVSTTIGVKGGVTGAGITAKVKLGSKDLSVIGNVDFASPQDTAYIIELEKGFLLTDIITLGATLAGMPDVSKYISSLPNVALNKCKLAFIPREMMLFGEMQKAGITLTGTVSILGKEATIFINFSRDGFYGDVSLDAINLILVKLEGLTDTKLKFAISGGQAGKPNGFYSDAKISIAVPPFGNLAKVKGTVYLVPSFIRITGLEASLGDLGKAVLDVSAGWDFNNFPTNLASVPWKFKAVLKKDAAGSLADSFTGAFKKMGECLK